MERCVPIINVGILAHVDAGKTTLTEQILYHCKAVRLLGSVDKGTTQTDWMPIERERGISVHSASATVYHSGVQINLIDTPGHVDFAGEVQRSLSVLDAAVLLISAPEGVQPHAELLWKALRELEIPTLIFVNKIDRTGSNFTRLSTQMRRLLSEELLWMQRWEGEETRECAVKEFTAQDGTFAEERLLLAAQLDPEVEALFMEGKPVPEAVMLAAMRRQIAAGRLFPVYSGAASLGIGITQLLDGMVSLLPSAVQDREAPLSGIIYKVDHDETMGKAAHVRLFTGCIQSRDAVYLRRLEREEKVTQVRRLMGQRAQDTGWIGAGDIGALYGLTGARTGDVLGQGELPCEYPLTVPLLKVQVFPEKAEQLPELVRALGELSEEDPLLDLEWLKEERELHIKITGLIQLEVLSALLLQRYRLPVTFSKPCVIYKETPAKAAEGFEAYTMPKPCWAVVRLLLEPGERGSGVVYRSTIKANQIPYRYQHHIETSVRETLKQGLYGWEVTDLKVTLIGGEDHHIHTHPLDFFTATPMALMDGLRNAGSVLLEPMNRVNLSGPEELVGSVIRDILAMRGRFDSPDIAGGSFSMQAVLPVATSLEYPVQFGMMSSGKGRIAMQFCGYESCDLALGATTPRRGIDPLDRSKWILHARSAL